METYVKIDKERWLDIVGFENCYQISDLGRVKSFAKIQNGFKEIIKKQVIDNRGYYRVSLGKNGTKKTLKVHRLVASNFCKNPYNYNEVNHIDGNKLNNNYINLEWCTRKQNMEHASKNNLLPKLCGEQNNCSKLKEKTVIYIIESKLTPKEISIKTGVNICSIYDIRSGRSWKHLPRKKKYTTNSIR